MCGIVGVLSPGPVSGAVVAAMRDTLAHRGPDHAGLWRSDDGRVCLGHRRLAVLDLTPEAHQPFVSHDGRFVVTLNGEIYNHAELRRELQAQGVVFRTRSDTEVLLEGFRRWRADALQRLSGMFAFAIWDATDHRLFCARDRSGEKPLYHASIDGHFVFGSELKALVAWPAFRRRLHYPALVDYLSLGFVPDPKTIWESCAKLPPAHCMWVDLPPGEPATITPPLPYWDMEFDPDVRESDWTPRIQATLARAVAEMRTADVPVGVLLSGGVDSSGVTAALRHTGQPVTTVTVGFDEPAYDERRWARAVARRYGTDHRERVVRADDVPAVLEHLVWHYDEPFNDYSYVPTFCLCREARQGVTVALSGDGGDETFAGYRKYQRLALRADVDRLAPRRLFEAAAARANAWLPEHNPWRRTLTQYGLDAPAMLADMLRSGLSRAALAGVARGPLAATLREYDSVEVIRALLRRANPREIGLVNAMRYLDLKLTLAGDILVKVDRASMAVALEVRPVYLHREMLALAARIPPDRLADRRRAKKALKEALRPWLPTGLVDRRKMGFAMPLNQWVGGTLHRMLLDPPRSDAFATVVHPGALPAAIRAHASGRGDRTAVIHSLVFLDRWLARWA